MQIDIRTVLCPVDFSECSNHALEYAKAFAQTHQARLILVHVIPPSVYAAPADPFLSDLSTQYEQQLRESAEKQLHTLTLEIEKQGLRVSAETLNGPAYLQIAEAAKREESDLIVMGTHGLTGIKHALMGSVAEKVVRMAPCPVLTVKHPEHDFVS